MQEDAAFRFDLQCPQCGAPAVLGEAELIVDCPYCRVRHLALSAPHPVSYIPPSIDCAGASLIFVPFWRFKGMALALVHGRIAHRLLDTSRLALAVSGLPVSLGLRSQTQPLHFVSPDLDGSFLRPTLQREGLLRNLNNRLLGLGPRVDREDGLQIHVGDTIGLIYAPFVLFDGILTDGLTGKPLEASAREMEAAPRCSPPQTLSFLPALCPHCGWELCGARDTLVLTCEHCSRFWTVDRGRLAPVHCRIQNGDMEESSWLPFWEFNLQDRGLRLTSFSDLYRLANLPRIAGTSPAERPLTFRIPAFKINPPVFLRLARQLTFYQPLSQTDISQPPGSSLFPVTLPAREAFQSLPMLLCRLAKQKRTLAEKLKDAQLIPRSVKLQYLRFRRRGLELMHEESGLSLQANALRFGRLL